MDANVTMSSTGNAMVDLVAMALFNNMAQLFFEGSQYEESRRFFDHLIQYTLTISTTNYGDGTVAQLMNVQRQNFLLNAIILNTPSVAAAA